MSRRLRRAGSPWRILVHEWLGKGKGTLYGTAHHVTNDRTFGRLTTGHQPDSEWSKTTEIAGTEFDELVIGRWIHLEQMDTGRWWMDIGGVTVWVAVDRDGRPQVVNVYGPGDYADPVEGVEYECNWSRP